MIGLTLSSVLAVWGVVTLASSGVILHDLRVNNPEIPRLMRAVWILTVLYSGVIGLAVYWYSGRTQIPRDSLWRRGFRSTAHCFSGCGLGEILGIIIAAGLLSLSTGGVAITTLSLAFLFGYALTVGPLLQDGVALSDAASDAFYTETASIAVMEIVAITTDIWLTGAATITDPRFWGALAVSLAAGFFAAYPVNLALLKLGVKQGMSDPSSASCH